MSKGINPYNGEHYPDPTAHSALTNILHEAKMEKREAENANAVRRMTFICSPFAGDVPNNVRMARKYARYAFLRNRVPIAPHLLFPQFLNDQRPAERSAGIDMGLMLLNQCGELWVFGGIVSRGMRCEIEYANRHRIRVRYFDEQCKEVDRYD